MFKSFFGTKKYNMEINYPHPFLSAVPSDPNKFQYTIELQDSLNPTIPTLIKTGQKVHFALTEHHTFSIVRPKKIQNDEQILLHFRLSFAEEKYRTTEEETIKKWTRLHENKPNLLTLKDVLNDPEVCEPVKVENVLPTNWIYLWKVGQECDFSLEFHATSNQFPVVKQNKYEPTLFLFIVDIFSAVKKTKLESAIFPFKVFWSYGSMLKGPIEVAFPKELPTKPVPKSTNSLLLADLLPALSLTKSSNVRAPDIRVFESMMPGYGLFSYVLQTSCLKEQSTGSAPKAYYEKFIPYIFMLNNLNFLDKFQMLRTTVQLCLNPSATNQTNDKEMDSLCAEWKMFYPTDKMLDFVLFSFLQNRENYNHLYEIYSHSSKQVDIIWSPVETLKLYLIFNLDLSEFHSSTVSNSAELSLSVQTFKRSESGLDILVDQAFCKIIPVRYLPQDLSAKQTQNSPTNAGLNKSSNNLTSVKKNFSKTLLKTQSNFVIHRILFISVDGSEYKVLFFQGFNYDKFKQDLLELITEAKPSIKKVGKISNLKFFLDQQNKSKHHSLLNAISLINEKAVFDCKICEVTKKASNTKSAKEVAVLYDVELTSQDSLIPEKEFNYF